MSLNQREADEVIWKLRRADPDQARRFRTVLGTSEVAEQVFEQIQDEYALDCPDCLETDEIRKHGTTPQGKQRYQCKACHRTFVGHHRMPFYRSQRTLDEWKAYFTEMLKGATLRELSIAFNMSINTAFDWRHKLLHALSLVEDRTKLAGRVWADATFLNYNEPGPDRETVPVEKDIAILVAKDYASRMFFRPVEPVKNGNPPSTSAVQQTFKLRLIEEHTTIISDGSKSIGKYCRDNGIEQEVHGSKSKEMDFINWLHSHFKTWIRNFRGVGSKYLTNYCVWYAFITNNKDILPRATAR